MTINCKHVVEGILKSRIIKINNRADRNYLPTENDLKIYNFTVYQINNVGDVVMAKDGELFHERWLNPSDLVLDFEMNEG